MEKLIQTASIFHLSINQQKLISLIIRLAFVLLFSYTAFDKLQHLESFSNGIGKVSFIGEMANVIAWGVPVSELLISVLLILPKTALWGLRMAIGLMIIFTLYLGLMLAFAEKRMCHCGGIIESMGWTEHLLFNLAFIGLGSGALYLNQSIHLKQQYHEN